MATEFDRRSIAYQEMESYWHKIHALKGGTEGMRAASTRFLPKEEAESEEAYRVRLNKTFLYEMYTDTVNKIVSKPFSRKVEIGSEDESFLRDFYWIQSDVDRAGSDVDTWIREVFEAAVDYGLTHVLVDYPIVPAGATLADERRIGARPNWVHIKPPMLIGWEYEGEGSNSILTRIRILEEKTETKDDFTEVTVQYVKIYTRQDVQVYRRALGETTPWVAMFTDAEGNPRPQQHTFGEIPLLTLYFRRTGFLRGLPAMNGLANLNIEHWQSSSDQRTVLTVARFGILFGKALDDSDNPGQPKKNIVIGPKRLVTATNPEADLKYVEHTGAAIQAGERDLANIQQRGEVLGLQPFIQRSGSETATSKVLHEQKTESAIHTWIRATEHLLDSCFRASAKWMKKSLPEDLNISIFSDFGISLGAETDYRVLLDLFMGGAIDGETLLIEVKRRGLLRESASIPEMLERLNDAINLNNVGLSGNGGDPAGGLPGDTRVDSDV